MNRTAAAALLTVLLAVPAFAADDLVALSDEFNDSTTLSQWKRVFATEGWNADQLEQQNINVTRPGAMLMMPFTSTWYNDYRGELTFKEVTGDFVVTTDVTVSQRNGSGAPRSQYSLGGIMVRFPRPITPSTWHPGGENYLFLSLGAASSPGTFQFEVKNTTSSNSVLSIDFAGTGHAQIQWTRIGPYFIALRNINGTWVVHRRYVRGDMPPTLQVGMTVYTDFPSAAMLQPFAHNSTVIHSGFPDLVAAFDFFRFERPKVPSSLTNANLMDVVAVPDFALLAFLGANATANAPSITQPPADTTVVRGGTATFSVTAEGEAPLTYQWRKDGVAIASQTSSTLTLANAQLADQAAYSVVVTNAVSSATSRDARLTVTAGKHRAGGK